jgi:hypothetical protein
VITRDNVSVKVNAVIYFKVMDPIKAVVEVENYLYATSQMSQTTLRSVLGQNGDFPISLHPLYFSGKDYAKETVPGKYVVVRDDTTKPIAIVSSRYSLVPHQRILDAIQETIGFLDVGLVPRGIYVDRQGARMRALFKFPDWARPVSDSGEICPCLKLETTYDGSSRSAFHLGAFWFVCTNLSVGGGGVFAGGFMSVYSGEIPVEEIADQLAIYLQEFEAIVKLYRFWSETPVRQESLIQIFQGVSKRHTDRIFQDLSVQNCESIYKAYNVATRYATHQMRSYRTAFDLLETINRGFQKQFPLS